MIKEELLYKKFMNDKPNISKKGEEDGEEEQKAGDFNEFILGAKSNNGEDEQILAK